MKVIYLQSIVLLLSASTAVARDVEGYLRQDTRRSSIIDEQQLINGIKELQVDEDSSRFLKLKAFKNLRLPWLTEHAAKHDNDDVHLEGEQDIIIGEHPWDDQYPSSTSVDQEKPRTLLSPWCPSTTPEKWHPDYSTAWSKEAVP